MSNNHNISLLPERELQRHVQRLISDPAKVLTTVSGKRLQILSPGELNVYEGPDFLDAAILLEGLVIVGDVEFHKSASDWKRHSHDDDNKYKNVILHVVMNNDSLGKLGNFETLVINYEDLENTIALPETNRIEPDDFSFEDLQHFALIRLLIKSAEIQKELNENGLKQTVKNIVLNYINRYNSRRKRPVYTDEKFNQIINNLENSAISNFLNSIEKGEIISVPDNLHVLMKTKIADEGAHLRREILLNCVIPLAICLANDEARISLFLWYWSTPSLHTYGILTRKFKNLPQNFLWEQQGMLEYMKEYGKRPNIVRDAIKTYGFAEILSFYRLGKAPFKYSDDVE